MSNSIMLNGASSMGQFRTLVPLAYKFGGDNHAQFVAGALEKGRTFDASFSDADLQSILVSSGVTCSTIAQQIAPREAHSPCPLLDLSKASPGIFTVPPPARDYVIDGLMVAGKSYVIAGFGGVSKTMLAIQLATSIASGADFFGHGAPLGAAILLLGEEDKDEIDRRLNVHWSHLNMSHDDRVEVAKRIAAFGLVGEDMRLTRLNGGNAEHTGFALEIIDTAAAHQKNCSLPIRLIVLDHARLAAGGDMNDAAHTTAAMREVNYIAKMTSAAVLVVAHSPKSAAQSETASAMDVAGSTALVDNARGAFVLSKLNKAEAKKRNIKDDAAGDLVLFSVVKNNYGPTGETILLCRRSVPSYQMSVLDLPDLPVYAVPLQTSKPSLRNTLLNTAKEQSGGLSKTKFIERFRRSNKESRREIESTVDMLIEEGLLAVRSPLPTEKQKYSLNGNVREVLVAN